MNNKRRYTIIIGSKQYFDEQIMLLISNFVSSDDNNFPQMVRKHDEYVKRVVVDFEQNKNVTKFERTGLLLIKNTDYHSIVSTAHDRLSGLIEELTTESADIYVHNPTRNLEEYLISQKRLEKIILETHSQKYDIVRNPQEFKKKMNDIAINIIGQKTALDEIGKSMWYLTHVKRKKPFVFMLYGNSSIGKTETVREIAKCFFNDRMFEKHLSMFRNERSQYFLFGDDPNRTSIGFELLDRESNLIFLDEFDKLPDFFYSVFYTLFDNIQFTDSTYQVDISGLLIFLTSNYLNLEEMKKHLGLPIYYRIDKFVQFEDFSIETIRTVTQKEIACHIEEIQGFFNANDLYNRVSKKVQTRGENARTLKNIVQQEVENMLYEDVIGRD